MNKYTEFNSKSFLIILLLVCVAFLVVVMTAFQYLPDKENNDIKSRTHINEINQPAQENQEEKAISEEENARSAEEEKVSEKTFKVAVPKQSESEGLENIDDLPADAKAENNDETIKKAEASPEEQAEEILFSVRKLKRDKQYVKALEELKRIPSLTNDVNTQAASYEEAATIYAIVKRYGTALSYAQKAYNMSPSSSREMLLARLYYKTGDIDKATRRINNVLQRDFSADR